MSRYHTLFGLCVSVFVLVNLVSGQSKVDKGLGEVCKRAEDCRGENVRCEQQQDRLAGVCLCERGFVAHTKDRCVEVAQSEGTKKAALIVTILVPLIAVALVITCLSVLCCYWAQLATKGAQQEARRARERYDVELDFYGANHIAGSKDKEEEEYSSTSSSGEDTDSEEENRPKMVRKGLNGSAVKKNDNKSSNKPVVPQLKVNGIVESSNKSNGHVLNKSESLPNGDSSNHISGTSTPILDRAASGAQDKGAGYQASLRHLLTTQQSEPSGGAMSRPTSAFFISNSRPNSSELLNPRQRPLSATGRPVGFVGPYVSDSSRLKRPISPRPPNTQILNPEGLSELYEKVVAIHDKEEEEQKEKEKAKKKPDSRRSSLKGGNGGGSGIEDIRLVKVAASAFKRRRNMKKVKEEQMRRKKGKKGKKFESLVDQIMRIREEQDRKPKAPKKLNWSQSTKARRDSRSSDGSSSNTSSRRTATMGRPESVAQRVLRERQEKRITNTNKTPTPPPPANPPTTQPLHVSLRLASAKPFTRSQLTERIKQQALLSVAKNYRTPVPLMMSQNHNISNPAPVHHHPPLPQPPAPKVVVDRGEVKPVKSILKKEGATGSANKGRVNIAFEGDNVNSNKNSRNVNVEKKSVGGIKEDKHVKAVVQAQVHHVAAV